MNFFVTGNEPFATGIDLKFVTPAGSHGANFSADGQSLSQSLSIAQEIFGRVTRGKIDFVLIGLSPDFFTCAEQNLTALSEYLKLCIDNGAKPVAVIFPVAPSVREIYRKKFVEPLRSILAELKKIYDFELVDLFDLSFSEERMSDETHLNSDGVLIASTILTFELYMRRIISFEELRRMSYAYFFILSHCSPVKFFQRFMNKIFRATVDELRRKDKIKIAFVTDHAATWCGDELYNFFARDKRFEPTIFICLAKNDSHIATMRKETARAVEQFRARGLNAVAVFDEDEPTPPQDLIIFLRPYGEFFPKTLRPVEQTAQTLFMYIHYSYQITVWRSHDAPIFRLAWKSFFDGELTRKLFDENCTIGMPRAYASGLPKMDSLSDATKKFSFSWKTVRPDAKKIIWAPHWSIFTEEDSTHYGTFQYNFRFMYEFAKNHPETSWVVKPHPKLFTEAVDLGVFSSAKELEEYFRAWNELPNAQVFTGAYYQSIFATSDGMIQDSGSFICEYQFTHKPMIFLTRKEQFFNKLGKRILDVSYCIDGQDLNGMAALMQKVFIDGDDPLKDARQKVFDELLDYRRINGMSASEYIFRSIADELEAI